MLPLALENDVIIFITPSYFHTILIPFLKLFRKKVYVISIDPQDVLKQNARNNFLKSIYYKISNTFEKMAIMKADKVFAVSRYLENEYSRINDNVIFATNGADVDYINSIKPKRKFKELTIAYFGSFDEWRGVDMLAEAFEKINRKNNKIKLLLLGGGSQEKKIRELCKNNGNIFISGFIDHKMAISYCKGSDLLVIPFRQNIILSHTAPIKSFEYVACGKPIVTTNTGDHADMIESLGAGIKSEPTAEGLEKSIEKLIRNRKLLKKLELSAKKASSQVDYRITRKKFREAFAQA